MLHTTTQGGSDVRDDRERKRKRVNTGSVGEDDFRMMSNEDKLDVIFSKLINIEQKQSSIEKLETVTQCNSSELSSLKKTATVHDDTLTFLSYKSLDLEARSRRKNLIFRGLGETRGEDCYGKITDFLYNELRFEEDNFVIDRAHRVGPRNRRNFLRRPMIVAFRDYYDVEKIIERAYMLKGTRFGVDRDYPKEINNARKLMWNRYKELRETKRRNDTVSLQFPAKIVVNGRVVEDAFPGWNDALKKVRVEPYVSQTVEAANRRVSDKTATDGHRSSYRQGGGTESSGNTGGRSDSDNRNVAVNPSGGSDQNTNAQQHDHNNNRNNFSGSNSSDDEDDQTFYTNYVSRMQNPQHSGRIDQSSSNRPNDYDYQNVNFSGWRDPNQPNNQPYNLSIRDYPPLTHQTGANSYNGKSGEHNMRSEHTGHVGSYSGFQGDQSTVNPNGTNERLQQSRDVDGGDRGPK